MPSPLSGSSRRLRAPLASTLCATLLAASGASAIGAVAADASTGPVASAAKGKATLGVKTVPGYGRVLVTASGKALYLLSTDPKGNSKCKGACIKQWVPLTVKGKPTAGANVTPKLLSKFKRKDGTTQVLYNGHALYTYSGPGVTGGAGLAEDGGIWYLVSPKGAAIKQTAGGGY